MKKSISPTKPSERIISIDILRGFALLGIVMVNVLGFNASFFDFGGFYGSIQNQVQAEFYSIYISLTADKFIFLFSFLFGYGIYMQYKKFAGVGFAHFFTKRMLVLGVFGIAHILFLWAGDILLLYAIAGIVMLLVYKLPTTWQILIALFFYFFIGIWLTIGVWIQLPNGLSSTCTECLEQAKIIYANGNYFECFNLRMQEYFAFRNINAFYYLPKIIGITMFGFIASKFSIHSRIKAHKAKWLGILVIVSIIGIVTYFSYEKIVNFESEFANAVYMTGYEFMNLFIASAYVMIILLIASIPALAKSLNFMALTGRMSLTNYIMQSLIMSIIFYGWGFGLFGETQVTTVVMIGLGVFAVQIILNVIWFRYYKQGPLEKLWRRFSYNRL